MHAQVKRAWAVLSGRESWEKLPKYALGVSSGAAMVSPYHPVTLPTLSHGRHVLIANLWKLLGNRCCMLDNIT